MTGVARFPGAETENESVTQSPRPAPGADFSDIICREKSSLGKKVILGNSHLGKSHFPHFGEKSFWGKVVWGKDLKPAKRKLSAKKKNLFP
jgi:hypothetical protein